MKNSPLAGLPLASVMLMSIATLVIAPVPSLLVIVSVPLKAERVSVAVWSICSLTVAQTPCPARSF